MATTKKTVLKNITTTINSNKDTATNLSTSSSTGTVGINTAGIKTMQNAISDYMKYLKKSVAISATNSQYTAAIKGDQSLNAIKALAKRVDESMTSYISNLTQFNTRLSELQASYQKTDQSNSTTISETLKSSNQ